MRKIVRFPSQPVKVLPSKIRRGFASLVPWLIASGTGIKATISAARTLFMIISFRQPGDWRRLSDNAGHQALESRELLRRWSSHRHEADHTLEPAVGAE